MNDKALSPQDAVDSFDGLRTRQVAFRFANESEAEECDRNGRIDEAPQSAIDVSWFPER